ncbi:hypothetical protein ACLK19_11160 [Escherichia coli]
MVLRVRRAAPWKDRQDVFFDATLDSFPGAIPLAIFLLSPDLVWNRGDRDIDRPTWRSIVGGYQRRHHSGFVACIACLLAEGEEKAGSRRVGELDEEMVYESRVNDIITLGATSWRIQRSLRSGDCDSCRVVCRSPFWRGEGNGRPAD